MQFNCSFTPNELSKNTTKAAAEEISTKTATQADSNVGVRATEQISKATAKRAAAVAVHHSKAANNRPHSRIARRNRRHHMQPQLAKPSHANKHLRLTRTRTDCNVGTNIIQFLNVIWKRKRID